MIPTTAFRFLAAAALFSTFVLAGCNSLPKQRGVSVQASSGVALEKKSPVDIAVAPVVNAAGNAELPAALLREAFQHGLVQRRYSPLALGYVDKKVQNAAYRPGSLQEEAVLQIAVERWDTTLWDEHSALTIKVQVRMLDAQNPGGPDLWSGRLDRRFDFAGKRDHFPTEQSLLRHACEEIAAEVLAALPARSPAPGYAAPAG